MKDRAIMLLKTHIEKMSVLGLAIISMKISGLSCSSHYVYEKKWTYLKPQIENEMGTNVENRSGFIPSSASPSKGSRTWTLRECRFHLRLMTCLAFGQGMTLNSKNPCVGTPSPSVYSLSY
jgi:hypothetical protein